MHGWVMMGACHGEQHDVRLQQRDGDVPRAVGLAQEADELGGNLGLRLAQRDAFQQRLLKNMTLGAGCGLN